MTEKPLTIDELQEKIRQEGERPIELPRQIAGQTQDGLVDTLTLEFTKIVLPSWLYMILLESGIVSTFLGIALFFGQPVILIAAGLLQAVPTAFILLRRIHKANDGTKANSVEKKTA